MARRPRFSPLAPQLYPRQRLENHSVSIAGARDIMTTDIFGECCAVIAANGANDQVLVSAFRHMVAHAAAQTCVPQSVTSSYSSRLHARTSSLEMPKTRRLGRGSST